MNEINEEIKLTMHTMQCDIDDGAHGELQKHLNGLLEIKRNELQQRLAGSQVVAKPLTKEELMLGGWWCTDVSEDCASAFISKGLSVYNLHAWGTGTAFKGCEMEDDGEIGRQFHDNNRGQKQIHRVGNEFYWGDA